jgi:hypothetical protein
MDYSVCMFQSIIWVLVMKFENDMHVIEHGNEYGQSCRDETMGIFVVERNECVLVTEKQ